MSSNSRYNIKYVYDLPYSERTELCHILDQNDKWEELGGKHMQFSMMEIQSLRREFYRYNSPTDELLTKWGHQNHTITELFTLLSRMQHYQSMRILKPFVDPKYHRLLSLGEENLSQMFKTAAPSSPTNSNGPPPGAHATKPAAAAEGEDELMNVAGAPPTSNPLVNKSMEYGQHNLNTTKAQQHNLLPVNKVALPPEMPDEKKIINVAENKENNEPESTQSPRRLSHASDISSVGESCGTIPSIPFKELMLATQGWDKQNILGRGGFGTVYKGTWRYTQVAIKRIEQRGAESAESYQGQMEQSLRELRVLNSCRHDNILPLYGYSIGGEKPCLVYQFMPNGSLEDRLLCRKASKPLSWQQRHTIAEGIARGLQFLHSNDKPFIHGDIKSANILLDVNLEPRIGDFGLARDGPHTQYTHMTVSRVHGTRPYLPEELLRSKKLSPKVDTFSYGVVLFEMCTGLRAYDENRAKKYLKEHVESCVETELQTIMDRKAGYEEQRVFFYLVQLGKCCVSHKPKDRPDMEVVLKQLESITAKRDMAIKALEVMRQNTPSPSTPYEIQVFHDRQSQMRQLSPAVSIQPPSFIHGGSGSSNAAVAPAHSPAESNVQMIHNGGHPNNPFLIFTPPQEHEFLNQNPHGLALNIPLALSRNSRNPSPTNGSWTNPPLPAFPGRMQGTASPTNMANGQMMSNPSSLGSVVQGQAMSNPIAPGFNIQGQMMLNPGSQRSPVQGQMMSNPSAQGSSGSSESLRTPVGSISPTPPALDRANIASSTEDESSLPATIDESTYLPVNLQDAEGSASDAGLPLLSALGIKEHEFSGPQESVTYPESSEQSSESSVIDTSSYSSISTSQPTAKGKKLMFALD